MPRIAPRLELFPFRFLDPVIGKWKRARNLAELHEIKARYQQPEIIGPPEIRDVDPHSRYFAPHRTPLTPVGNLGPIIEPAAWRFRSARELLIVGIAV